MYNQSFNSRSTEVLERNPSNRMMKPEQFDQVIDAILSGKYSWACVLILRFSGYNPLHYIPYRTYNRIVKDNTAQLEPKQNVRPFSKSFEDLNYLEDALDDNKRVQGGSCSNHSSIWQGWQMRW